MTSGLQDTPPPRASVLLCLYNGEKFLAPTIESVMKQTFSDFELLVIDDGSTDGSLEVVRRFQHDPRLRLICQKNQGTAGAMKTGFEAACGDYIAFLDQDDLWEEDYLDSHIELLSARPEIALSFSWFAIINEAGRDTGLESSRFRDTIDFQGLLIDFVIGGTSNIVARRAAIEQAGGSDPAFRRLYNVDLCLRIALLGSRNIAAIPRNLMRYRRHSGQMSLDIDGLAAEWDRLIDNFEHLRPELVAPIRRRAYSNQLRYLARVAYESELYPLALRLLARGFSKAPGTFVGDRRNWLTLTASVSGLLLPRRLHAALERQAGFRRGVPNRTL